jgi:arginyl-tRNA synthetase
LLLDHKYRTDDSPEGFTYDTSDMAALKCRLEEDKAHWLVYVVDSGQSEHFNLLFAGARRAKLYDPEQTRYGVNPVA